MNAPLYEAIELSTTDTNGSYAVIGPAPQALTNLSQINLLVGPNNSGKSRLLRSIFKSTQLSYRPHGFNAPEIAAAIRTTHEAIQRAFNYTVGEIVAFSNINKSLIANYLTTSWIPEKTDPFNELKNTINRVIKLENFNNIHSTAHNSDPANYAQQVHQKLLEPLGTLLKQLERIPPIRPRTNRIYIPILRGLRTISTISNDEYADRTRADYEIKAEYGEVFTGLHLYNTLRDMLLGSHSERKSVQEYEEFLSQQLFDGRHVELIPHRAGQVLHMRLGETEEHPIHQLGDGLQSLIALTFPAFQAKEPSIICIEEPETHLHPGMQRKLVELFTTHEKLSMHQVFASTHSNHLIDMAGDYTKVSTLLVRKTQREIRFEIRVLKHSDRMVLEDLGVRTSSVFLTNATIWVEGITDRLYLREYLAKYLLTHATSIKLREDTHFSFMEGGGSCIAHFDFSKEGSIEDLKAPIKVAGLCTNSFVVLDGDNKTKPRRDSIEKALGENLFLLEGKEVENLLPLEVIRAYVKAREASLDTSQLKLGDYHKKSKGLGEILDDKFEVTLFANERTIKNKMGLCNFSLEFMRNNPDSWQLTPEAAALCEQLVRFICKANEIRESDTQAK